MPARLSRRVAEALLLLMFVALGAWLPLWLGDREGFRAHEVTSVATLTPTLPRPSDPDRPALREAYALGRVAVFLRGVASGNLSAARDPTVNLGKIIHEGLPVTSGLSLVGLGCALLFGLPTGIALTRRARSGVAFRLARALVLTGESAPSWVVGPVLVFIFALCLAWLAPARWDGPDTMVLPGLAIGLPVSAVLAGGMARAPLRGRMADVAGATAVALLVSLVATEVVFSIPGLGQSFVRAVLDHDTVMAAGLWAWLGAFAVLVRFLAGLVDDLLPDPGAVEREASRPNPAGIGRYELFSGLWRSRWSRAALMVLSAIVLLALAGPMLASLFGGDPLESMRSSPGARPPTLDHLFGTDKLGRDLLVQVLAALRASLVVALAATTMALLVGAPAGFAAGWVDYLRGRRLVHFESSLSSIPWLVLLPPVLVIALRAKWSFLGADAAFVLTIGLLGAIFAFSVYRAVRAVTVAAWSSGWTDAAQALGLGPLRVAAAHVAPACLPTMGREALRILPTALLAEGFLAFLVGIHRNPRISLGSLLSEGTRVVSTYPWVLVLPALVLFVTAFCGFTVFWDLEQSIGTPPLAPGARRNDE